MPLSTPLHGYAFGPVTVRLALPETGHGAPPPGSETAQPYWAKVWPAALALCGCLAERAELVQNRTVLELGAGLGLPGLVAARLGGRVTLSDREAAAVEWMARNAAHNGGLAVRCRQLDWSALPEDAFAAERLLLSDVNYDPGIFETLYAVLRRFLRGGTEVLLATPQRLMAKPFIERLLPFAVAQEERLVRTETESAWISLFHLREEGAGR